MTEQQEKIVQTAGRDRLGDFAPEFAHYNDDILFGENWNNQDLDLKTRCLLTVTALMAQGITDASMEHHLQNANDAVAALPAGTGQCLPHNNGAKAGTHTPHAVQPAHMAAFVV